MRSLKRLNKGEARVVAGRRNSDYLHFNNKLPEAKCIRKCVNFVCWNAFSSLNIWLLAQQCKNMLPN